MQWPVEFFVGTRYIHARRDNHLIGLISLTAILATTLGVAVLLTITSIMNGFQHELQNRVLGMSAHVQVEAGTLDAAAWRAALIELDSDARVAGAAPYLERDVLIQQRGQVRAVTARGIDPDNEFAATTLGQHLSATRALTPGAFLVYLGRELAADLGVDSGDTVTLVAPRPLVTPAGFVPRMKRFTVAGVFEFGLADHDSGLVVLARRDAQRFFRAGERVDGIRVRLADAGAATEFATELRQRSGLPVRDWTETHRNLFRALQIEKVVMFVMLALAIAIAAFNVISILFVAVTEKRGDIAMLRALGMARASVMRIFLVQGGITGLLGVLGGVVLGTLLSLHIDRIVNFFETVLGIRLLSPDVFYISAIPSDPRLFDFVLTALIATLIAIGAPLYPAWIASRGDPASGLRHE